jgi:hypothetical protein
MTQGDYVLAWQTNKSAAVALCRVARLVGWTDTNGSQRDMELELIKKFDEPGVKLLEMRKTQPALAKAMGAFQRGFAGTLYATSPADAQVLLRACHVKLSTLLPTARS